MTSSSWPNSWPWQRASGWQECWNSRAGWQSICLQPLLSWGACGLWEWLALLQAQHGTANGANIQIPEVHGQSGVAALKRRPKWASAAQPTVTSNWRRSKVLVHAVQNYNLGHYWQSCWLCGGHCRHLLVAQTAGPDIGCLLIKTLCHAPPSCLQDGQGLGW